MKWGPMWLWWEFKTQKLPLDGTLDNGLSPGRRLAIIWANAGVLLIGPLGTNFSEISVEIYTFSFKKMHWILKMSSGKWRPFCFGLIVLSWEIGARSRAACDESLLDSPDDVHPGGWLGSLGTAYNPWVGLENKNTGGTSSTWSSLYRWVSCQGNCFTHQCQTVNGNLNSGYHTNN